MADAMILVQQFLNTCVDFDEKTLEIHFQIPGLLNEFGLRGNGDECEAAT